MGRGSGVTATKDNTIQVTFRYKGVRCRERLKLAPTPANLKYAARLKATIEHEIATQVFDYAKHFPNSARARTGHERHYLGDSLRAYVSSLAGSVEPETARDYGRDAEIVAGWFAPEATLEGLTRKDIRSAITRQALSKQRIDNMMRPLRGALEQALEDGVITKNPMHGFKVRRIEEDEPEDDVIDPFTPAEIESLSNQKCGGLWTFWAWTGLRSGEVIGLRWSDVSLGCDSISVRRAVRLGRTKKTKTKAGTRRLTLQPAAKAVLSAMPRGEPDAPVFINPNTENHWHEAKALNRAFGRACKHANVRYRYSYQLRHTFATWALSSGENPMWVASYMGHKDTSIIYRHYGKWMPGLDTKAGSRMVRAAVTKKADAA